MTGPTLLVALTLCGCGAFKDATSAGARPVVRASDGSSASLTVIACPPTEARSVAVGQLIEQLTRTEEIVSARSGGTARLTINACPSGLPPEEKARRR